ncbi:hypothetical protein [Actinomadura kijaniata]|uniref:hypothetical protein n=1 Tax=Actinomadura kijaniata TaxID=46161 RepID=UPI00082B3E06|nr:hypothetical protein [Actinomadura kijaniata]
MKSLPLTVLTAALAVPTALAAPTAPLAQAAPAPAATPKAQGSRTVTLVTGDRVRVRDGAVAGIDPGPGRDRIAFQQFGAGRELTVLPSDAASRRLDPRLFRIGGGAAPAPRAAADHGLKVEVLDRTGRPLTGPATVAVVSRDDPGFGTWWISPGEELPVPPGRYAVHALAGDHRAGGPFLEIMAPEVRVDGDTTVTLDGRGARRVKLGVARPTARAKYWGTGMTVKAPPGSGYLHRQWTSFLPDDAEVYAKVTEPSPDFTFNVRGVFQEPLIRLDVEGDASFPVDVSYAENDDEDEGGKGSPRLLGTHGLKAVHGGAGEPDDLKDVAGALVVLDLPDGAGAALPERVANVAKAGGRAVLLGGAGGAPSYSGDLALPTLVARGEAAERLRRLAEAAPVSVTTRGIEASPYSYNLVHPTAGRVPDNPVYLDRDEDLAAGRITYRGAGAAGTAWLSAGTRFGELSIGQGEEPIRVPSVRTEYYPAQEGVLFGRTLFGSGDGTPLLVSRARAHRPGERFAETMAKGVLGPGLATPTQPVKETHRPAWVFRRDDTIDVSVPTFTDDQPGHYGLNYADSEKSAGATRLYRDGALVGETSEPGTGVFKVPAAPGSYRLDVEANVGTPEWQATTGVRASWTFASAGNGGTTPLPLTAVRFSPSLNHLNQGPAGREVSIPVRVEHQAGAAAAPVTSLAVKASYDDGAHWRPLPVVRAGDHWVVRLRNPGQGAVSLRALVRDASGTTLDQTIRRAYTVG